MTEQHSKLKAVALAGLMVLSVFAVTMVFSGAATAQVANERGGQPWDPDGPSANGDVGVATGSSVVVFQGEEGIDTFVGAGGADVAPESFQMDGESDVLELPIPEDQPTGTYVSSDGDATSNLIVRTPRITDFEITSDGESVEGGIIPVASEDGATLTASADYNFQRVTNLDLVVREGGEDGLDVTDEVLDSDQAQWDADGEVSWTIDRTDLDSDTEYSFAFQADSTDLRHGQGQQTTSIDVSASDDFELNLEESEVVQGQQVQYDVAGGEEGTEFLVWIDSGDIEDAGEAGSIFRNVGDVSQRGTTGSNAYAIVEIDGGEGVGSIASGPLDDTDVTVSTAPIDDWTEGDDLPTTDDDTTLTVTEGSVTLENPTDTYFPGASVTVNGTATEGIDEVTLYARDQGDYRRVLIDGSPTIDVSGDEFEEENVQLGLAESSEGGNDLLSYTGNYRLAAVAGDTGTRLSTTDLAQQVNDRHSIRVQESEFRVNTSVVDGEVAVGDTIEVSGYAPGGDVINVSFIGPRGTFDQYANINVDSDGYFEEEDVVIGGNIRDRFRANIADLTGNPDVAEASIPDDFSSLSKGNVVMSVGHKGRDGVMGDGVEPDVTADIEIYAPGQSSPFTTESRSGLVGLIYQINTGQWTQGQVAERLIAETGSDVGSDDPSSVVQFRLTDPRTTVDNVVGEAGVNGTVEVGSEMAVEGTTNRQPDDNTITVEVIDGPSRTDFDLVSIDEWSLDGQWNATLDTEGLQPGTYTVEASDDTSSDIHEFQLSETVDDDTPTPTATDTPVDETDTPTDTPGNATETTTEGQEGPGFTVVAAIVGLLAAALLAVRRHS